MPLTEEIKQAAQELGKHLGNHAEVQAYLRGVAAIQQDADVSSLEAQYHHVYQELLARQERGEFLDRAMLAPFYQLKREIEIHPLLVGRDSHFKLVQALFNQTSQKISSTIMLDYSVYARPKE